MRPVIVLQHHLARRLLLGTRRGPLGPRPVVAFLLSDACRDVTGPTIRVDGGALMRS